MGKTPLRRRVGYIRQKKKKRLGDKKILTETEHTADTQRSNYVSGQNTMYGQQKVYTSTLSVMAELSLLQQKGVLCDASLHTGNVVTKVHQLVLIAASPRLKTMYTGVTASKEMVIVLPASIKPESLTEFLHYLYDGFMTLTVDNFRDIEKINSFFQVNQVASCCEDFRSLLLPCQKQLAIQLNSAVTVDGPSSTVQFSRPSNKNVEAEENSQENLDGYTEVKQEIQPTQHLLVAGVEGGANDTLGLGPQETTSQNESFSERRKSRKRKAPLQSDTEKAQDGTDCNSASDATMVDLSGIKIERVEDDGSIKYMVLDSHEIWTNADAPTSSSKRITKRKYHNQSLEEAVTAVKQKQLSLAQASKVFDVPRQTISNHVRGISTKSTFGPARILDEEAELSVVSYLEYMAGQGFPMTRAMIRSYIIGLLHKSERKSLFNMDFGPSHKWFRAFFSRHPQLQERFPEQYCRSKSTMSKADDTNQFFDMLEGTVVKLNIRDKPHLIYNADEIEWTEIESREKVTETEGSDTSQQAKTESGHITSHLCVSADGKILPSFLIFQESQPDKENENDVPEEWIYATSKSGHMDRGLFLSWFEKIFLKHCGTERPVLLIMDNHHSHLNLEIVKMAKDNGVELLGLPAHTTRILQPLDVGIKGPLKRNFSAMAGKLGFFSKQMVVNKENFPAVLSAAIDHVCSPDVIKTAFKKCGIFPLDREAVDKSKITPSAKKDRITSESSSSSKEGTTSPTRSHNTDVSRLVEEKTIPEPTAQICPPEPAEPEGAGRNLEQKAGRISSEDFCASLEKRKKEKEDREDMTKKRKKMKEKKHEKIKSCSKKSKKSEKLDGKDEKDGSKISKKPSSQLQTKLKDSIKVCQICGGNCHDGSDDMNENKMIKCDKCDSWYHHLCMGLDEECLIDAAYFMCQKCYDAV